VKTRVFDDGESLGRAAAELTVVAASEAIAKRGVFHLVLAGGNTPRMCYEKLRDMDMDWSHVHVWFGDERCVPAGHADRNDRMTDETLLGHVRVPQTQIHRMAGDLGAKEGAKAYAESLTKVFGEKKPVFDMIHLGMGEDGHTASLFPGHATLDDARAVLPVFDSPKPPPERITLGLSVLNLARQKLILAAGAGKSGALRRIRNGEKLPVAMIDGACWLVDREANLGKA